MSIIASELNSTFGTTRNTTADKMTAKVELKVVVRNHRQPRRSFSEIYLQKKHRAELCV